MAASARCGRLAALGVVVAAGCSTHVSPNDSAATAHGHAGGDARKAAPDGEAGDARTMGGGATIGAASSRAPVECAGKRGATGDRTLSVSTADGARTAYLHVPAKYEPTLGAMLILSFHGLSSNAAAQRSASGLDAIADDRGFLVVYPEGLLGEGSDSRVQAWNAGFCCGSHDDKAFVQALLAEIQAEYCVDRRRVYSTGMSMGGMFSYRLACELADTVASIAPVAAGMLLRPITDCKPSRAVPVLAIHGTRDPLVPYAGGADGLHPFTWSSQADEMQLWREIDRCAGSSSENVYRQGSASCEQWGPCATGSHVQLCTIDGGGHVWPGASPPSSADFSASQHIVRFFEQHPMP